MCSEANDSINGLNLLVASIFRLGDMRGCKEVQMPGYIKMFLAKQGDAFTSKTRAGSHRLFLKMTPIREAVEELADVPFGHAKKPVLHGDDLWPVGQTSVHPPLSCPWQDSPGQAFTLSTPTAPGEGAQFWQ